MLTDVRADLITVIFSMEVEMRRMGLWDEEPPPAEALRSKEPFCLDTLRFEQWLQWVFMLRMKDILEQGKALPDKCDIYPLAEEALPEMGVESGALLDLIKRCDHLINYARGVRGLH